MAPSRPVQSRPASGAGSCANTPSRCLLPAAQERTAHLDVVSLPPIRRRSIHIKDRALSRGDASAPENIPMVTMKPEKKAKGPEENPGLCMQVRQRLKMGLLVLF